MVTAAVVGSAVYSSQDTHREVELRYADRFDVIRQAFHDVARQMPPTGQIRETGCPGVPPGQHLFDHEDRPVERVAGNTVVVSQAQLTEHTNWPPDEFAIAPGATLLGLLERTAPGYQPTERDEEWADDGYAGFVEALSSVRYVVVTRVYNVNPGSAGLHTFTGGSMRVEALIVDLRSRAVLCTASTEAVVTAEHLLYRFPEGADEDSRLDSAESTVRSALRAAATAALEEELNSLGHGDFRL